MSISIKIHDTDLTAQTCVVTIKDDNVIVLDKKNIGLEFNPDGTANTAWIIDAAKEVVLGRRKAKSVQDSIDKITSTINTSSEE